MRHPRTSRGDLDLVAGTIEGDINKLRISKRADNTTDKEANQANILGNNGDRLVESTRKSNENSPQPVRPSEPLEIQKIDMVDQSKASNFDEEKDTLKLLEQGAPKITESTWHRMAKPDLSALPGTDRRVQAALRRRQTLTKNLINKAL